MPQVLLYQAHALITGWDYEATIPILKDYISKAQDEYQQIIGKINLASAYVHERYFHEAEDLLKELEKSTSKNNLSALYGNTLERFAELSIHQRDWVAAERYLKEAELSVQKAGGFDVFFVQKWRTILRLFQKPKSNIDELEKFREMAFAKRHWETVRECDAYRAIICKDELFLLKVYFGTPFQNYRKRLLTDFAKPVKIPETFAWSLEGGNGKKEKYDLFRSDNSLKFGQLKQRLLRIMTSDFYRPFRVAHLFAEVYPGEPFHINGSRAKIHEGISHLRRWLKKKKIKIDIGEHRGEYRITGQQVNVTLLIPGIEWWNQNTFNGLDLIRQKTEGQSFSAAEFSDWLNIPRRTAFEKLKEGVDQNVLERLGAGPTTRYRIK